MEGLIRGLVDVAIGHNNNDDDDGNNDNNNNNNSERVEQTSRSTWAEVVSGEQDEDQENDQREKPRHDNNRRGNRAGEGYGSNEYDSGTQSRPHQQQQQRVNENYQREEHEEGRQGQGYNQNRKEQQENADGWQTAKHHKRPQKPIRLDQWNSYKRPPSEQEYSEEVKPASELEPSEEELADYRRACSKLWELDYNRLTPGKEYEIDIGEGTRVHEREDKAEASLFTWVAEDVYRKPTFARFCSLLDNYNPHSGYKEDVTAEERQEQTAFIEEISRTAPIKYLYKYLSRSGTFNGDHQEFKAMLIDLWFTLYGRGGTSGSSSSFEHVFVGEIKQREGQEVSGFHNWLQFCLEEAKGRVDYQGYIRPRRRGECPDSEAQVLTVQFEWNGVLKNVSTMFVGVSPEFELALYTLCFFAGGEDNRVEVGPYPVNVKCYRLGNKIGSAFSIAEN